MAKKEVTVVEPQNEIIVQENNAVIDEETIKNYFCKNATSSELALGVMICKQQGLNPFKGDVHFVKFGEQKMQVIVSKYAYLKRAEENPNYDGFKAWVEQEGDELVGKCEVYRKDRKTPIYCEAYFSEYDQQNKTWKEKPKTMIRKVALVQALREAFPMELGGLYSEEEITPEQSFTNVVDLKNIEQELQLLMTIDELNDWYKTNKKIVNQEVLKLLTARKQEIIKANQVIDVEVVNNDN